MTIARKGPLSSPPTAQVGDLQVTILDGGHLWLDGGAMFGIIPKPLWSTMTEVDESNRIPLAMSCFLVETQGTRILVETGAGRAEKYSDKERGFFRLSGPSIVDSLAAVGLEPGQIDIVIVTHLHFDHAGGGTSPDGAGGMKPTFPRARYVVQRGEWQDAVEGHAVMSGTYRRENLAPLEEAGVLSLVDNDDAQVAPGVAVTLLPGHTRYQQGVVFQHGERRVVLPADLMPTSAHAGLRYNMAYDLLPHENMCNKKRLLADATDHDWLLFLGQDPRQVLWRVSVEERGRHVLLPVSQS